MLLLPRQIISDSIGTCYEEYVQDANRHYKVILREYLHLFKSQNNEPLPNIDFIELDSKNFKF